MDDKIKKEPKKTASGGGILAISGTVMHCLNPDCNFIKDYIGEDYVGKTILCPKCNQNTFYGEKLI